MRVLASYPIVLTLDSYSFIPSVIQVFDKCSSRAARYKVYYSLEPLTKTARRVQPFTSQMRKWCHFLVCTACAQGPGSGISYLLSVLDLITLK